MRDGVSPQDYTMNEIEVFFQKCEMAHAWPSTPGVLVTDLEKANVVKKG